MVGKLYFDHRPFETVKDGAPNWNPWKVREFYQALGLELPEMDELEGVLSNIVASGMVVTFDLKTKGKFQNMEIVEAHENALEEAAAPSKPAKPSKAAPAEKPKPSREATKSTEKDPEPVLPTEEDVEDWDKNQCSKFCKANGIEEQKTISKTKAKIMEWVDAQGSDEGSDEDSSSGLDPKEAALKESLIELGTSIGADVNDGMSLDELKEELGSYEYDSETSTEDEIKLLESVGLGDCITRPAPKKAAKKK